MTARFIIRSASVTALLASAILPSTVFALGEKAQPEPALRAPIELNASDSPRHHISFTPETQASNDHRQFVSMHASLPDRAIRMYLHKIGCEPNSLTGLLSTTAQPAQAGVPNVPSVNDAAAQFSSGEGHILTPAGNAIPTPSGGTAGFFK